MSDLGDRRDSSDSDKKAAPRPFLRPLGWFAAGFLAGGVVAFYALCWMVYGMGHTSHPCNTAGAILAVACPVLGILVLVLVATGRFSAMSRERRTALTYGLLGFLCGPASMLLLDKFVIYPIGDAFHVYPPLQGW